ncbi:1753_t:CDS:1 [Dentiscutata heterogama]|uniref:1753_t:CDS:1 n=1 Tax=Dentiscutata heterogama TaxID=1316150 RepID=A0ACA9K8C2_9GLOM|nr:1753_t:CDS:1 [Dentiscutata heterogama]
MPSNIEFQKWGKELWELLGRDKQAVANHIQNLSNGNSLAPNFGQNIHLIGNFTGNSLNNGQENLPNESQVENSSNNEQEITSGRSLANGDLDGSHRELTLPTQETSSVNFNDNTLVIWDESMLSMVNGDFAEDFLISCEQTSPEVRSSRTINRQQYRLSRSPSRENRQTRQEARNREPLSRSPTSDGDRMLQLPNDRLQIPIDRVYYSPNHTEYQFSFNHSISNNSSSAHITSPNNTFENLSNQSTPLLDFEISSFINSTTNLQTTPLFNLEEISQYSIDPQTSDFGGTDWQPFFFE